MVANLTTYFVPLSSIAQAVAEAAAQAAASKPPPVNNQIVQAPNLKGGYDSVYNHWSKKRTAINQDNGVHKIRLKQVQ